MTQIGQTCEKWLKIAIFRKKFLLMRFKRIVAILSLSAAVFPLRAADPETWHRFDGITSLLSVHSLCQDGEGTIWFGTDRSLYSFDGYELRAHTYEGGNILINSVRVFGNDVYMGTNSGLYRFDRLTGRTESAEELAGKVVRALEASRDTLWIGTEDGLYARVAGEARTPRLAAGMDIYSLALSGDCLYMGLRNELVAFHPSSGRTVSVLQGGRAVPGQRIRLVTCILPRDEGGLWFGTPTSLYFFDNSSGAVEELSAFPIPKSLCREGNVLLVGTDGGLFRYDLVSGKAEKETSDAVWALMKDRQQGFWMGSDSGLGRRVEPSVFVSLEGLPEVDGFRYESLLKDGKGRIWLGGNRGIVLIEGGKPTYFHVGSPTHPIQHNKINSITEDPGTGAVYVGTDIGYLLYDDRTRQFERHGIPGTNNWIYDILADGDDLWFATYDGLVQMREGRVVRTCTRENGLYDEDVVRVVKAASGDLVFLTRDQRLWKYEVDTGRLEECDFSGILDVPLVDNVLSDRDGTVWLRSRNRLLSLGPSGPVVKADLVLDDPVSVQSMTDIGDRILLCTTEGVFTVGKETGSIQCINADRRYAGAMYDGRTRELLFGGLETAETVQVDALDAEMGKPLLPARFTGIVVNGEEEVPRNVLLSRRVSLGYRDNNLIVRFSDYNYDREARRRFLFRLEGRHSGWSRMVSDQSISVSGLSPGLYRITIGPGDGTVTDSLRLRIRRPFYLSWGMMAVYLAFFIALVIWIISYFLMRKEYKIEQKKRDLLAEQSRQKSDFFMRIAHELKTPLSMVIAPLSKAETDCPKGPVHELVSLAKENAMKISSLLHVTMDIYGNRKEIAGSLILTDVEFVEFARNILETFRRNYPDREFVFSSAGERMYVNVDIIKMETCLNNLLSNACKYTMEDGAIILTLDWNPSGDLVIKVSDTGIGIPKKDLPFVFQRFFQSSRTHGGGFDSTGVGLSILQEYVELHGGAVSADSDENGTTFVVTVPSRKESLESENSQPESAPETAGMPLVAIVEDNLQVCSFLEKVLGSRYRCVSVHNGRSGLKLCRDILPDLIVSDVLMPVMDGLEMCRQIRAFRPLATVPIILLTAKGDSRTEKESINLGIDAFIPKPFDLSVLLSKVDQLLDSHKRMEQSVRLELFAAPDPSVELSYDEKLLKKVTGLIEEHLDDHELSVTELCRLGGYNEKQLYRKLKQMTGMSTVEYIRSIRLKKAALMLQNGGFTVSEVMYSVGFSNMSYFSRAFFAQFHQTPSEYMKSHRSATS